MIQVEIVEDVVCGFLQEPIIQGTIVFLMIATMVGSIRSLRQIRDDLDNAHNAGELDIRAHDHLIDPDGVDQMIEATWMIISLGIFLLLLIVIGVDIGACL